MTATLSADKGSLLSREWRGRRYLFSPVLDFLMVGGGALIMLAWSLMTWTGPDGKKIYDPPASFPALFFLLSLVVNYPHFMMSYQILYSGFGAKLKRFRNTPQMFWRYIIAGLLVPALLIALMSWTSYQAAVNKYLVPSGVAVLAMLFFVGWHYIKQAFGVFMMLSALKSIYYNKWVRRMLLLNCYVIWIGSFLYSWGIVGNYALGTVFNPSRATIPLIYVILTQRMLDNIFYIMAASTILTYGVLIYACFRQKRFPSLTALIGYSSLYYLFATTVWSPYSFIYAAPFFHSLQYLLFTLAWRRGKYEKELAAHAPEAGKPSLKPALGFFMFALLALILGKLSFYYIPAHLDSYLFEKYNGLFPTNYFVMVFTVFINIHHYFVDNVIWRKENTEVGEYILGAKPA